MRFYKVNVDEDEDNFHEIYWVEADPLISESEMVEYVTSVATANYLAAEPKEIIGFNVTPNQIDMDEYLVSVCDYQHVRPALIITSLNNIGNTIIAINASYKEDVSEEPEYFIFSGAAGQDSDVTAIGKTDKNLPREQVIQDGYNDILYQLKKYFQVSGVIMASGLFIIQSISPEEYSLEYCERELVFK